MVEKVLDKTIPAYLPDLVLRSTGDLIEAWVSPDVAENPFKSTLRLMTQEAVRKELAKTYNPPQPIQVLNAQTRHPNIPIHDETTIGRDGVAITGGTSGPRAFPDNNHPLTDTQIIPLIDTTIIPFNPPNQKSRKGKKKTKKRNHSDSDSSDSDSSSDQNGDGYSDNEQDPHRPQSSKSTLKVIRPLNDLFTKAVDYRTYRLDKSSSRSDISPKAIRNAKKRIDTQLSRSTFTGTDPIAILGFLTKFRNACNHNAVSEGKAMWLFQYYLTGRALHLLQSRMNVSSLAVDDPYDETISSYSEVVNFLLQTYATNEVITTAYADLTGFVQASGQSETEFGDKLWDKAIRCGSVISNQRLRSMYAEGVLSSIRAQVRNHSANHPNLTFDALNRYAQALGDPMRAARKPNQVGFRVSDTAKPTAKRSVLSVDTDSVTSYESDAYSVAQQILAISQGGYTSPGTSSASDYFTRKSVTPPSSAPSPVPTAALADLICWFCLSRDHTPATCPYIKDSVRQQMIITRKNNFFGLRNQGLSLFTGRPRGPRPPTPAPVAMVQTDTPVTPLQQTTIHHMEVPPTENQPTS